MRGIPSPPTRFVGRVAEQRAIAELLGQHRLVTLLGPGGAGKTRLAIEVARASAEARFVDLASARTAADLWSQVVEALGGGRAGGGWEAIGELLETRGRLLLVLDNVEQIAEPAAKAVSAWIARAPKLGVLLTSRQRLGIAGEVSFEVAPLPVPPESEVALASIAAHDAVALFVDRVRAVRTGFRLTPESAPRVAALVRALQGLPLAVELAAARFDVLALDGLIAGMEDPLGLLLKGPIDAPARHATLRDAIAWSWSLLGAEERVAVAQCAVFRGGFDRAAAEAVLDAPRPVVTLLEALRDRSLLVVSGDDAPRFDLLVGIRAFAEATPDEAEARDRARGRHAEHFRRHGGPVERDNLRAALEHHLAASSHAALDVLALLEPIYRATGPVAELARLAERTHRVAPAVAALRMWGRALHHAGDSAGARAILGRALDAATTPEERGTLLVDLGILDHHGDVDAAMQAYERALELHRRADDRRGIGRALGNIGALHHDLRRWDQARAHYTAALDHLDDVGLRGRFLANLGVLEGELERRAEARLCFERALAALAATHDRRLEAITRANLGVLEQDEDRLDLARAHHAGALAMLEEIGDPRSIVLAEARLAGVEALVGEETAARSRLARAVLSARRLGDPVVEDVVSLAHGYVELADAARAWARGHVAEARAHTERILARVGHASVDRSDDARAMVRQLQRRVAALSPGPSRSLGVAPAGRAFRAPDGTHADLRRRHPLRRLLLELIEARRRAPGTAVSAERLIEVAWPGERIRLDAATNRLYVALATLRKQGLKDVIVSAKDGYLLDPTLPVVWEDAPPHGARDEEGIDGEGARDREGRPPDDSGG